MTPPIILCGVDTEPEERGDCPDSLHDWPLPEGYVVAHETAQHRLRHQWTQRRCEVCGLYGWIPGRTDCKDCRPEKKEVSREHSDR